MKRRELLKFGGAAAGLAALSACTPPVKGSPRVVVVGAGFGGATLAKYLRLWSAGGVEVTLVERNEHFVSCPMSNLVIGAGKSLADLTLGYDALRNKWGVRVVHDEVLGVDAEKHRLRLAKGGEMSYDRLALSPGIDFLTDQIPGLASPEAQSTILHAWKAGPQTLALRRQLEGLPDGGIYAIGIPRAPYRCPPGPYERACLVAEYFKRDKPRSKVVILDANEEVVSKKGLFMQAWTDLYPGIIDYRPNSEVKEVHARSGTAVLEFDEVKADVLNIVPPQRAGRIAVDAGLKLINGKWVDIDWLSMESASTPGVHVIGDAIFPAPAMPKSGHMANQQAKLAAAAILRLLAGEAPNPAPVVMNTCYSYVDSTHAIHVASVHQYDGATRTMQPVKGAGGVSAARNEKEAQVAQDWAKNIWADMLA